MIFLAVGTQFPFDRLVKAVDDAVTKNILGEEIIAQIGESLYKPHNFEAVASLDKKAFDEYLKQASCVIGHAGMGIITTTMDNKKPLLVMPRLKKYGEAVNDHQLAIAREFEKLGHILVAYGEEELPAKLEKLKTFAPVPRKNQAGTVAARISQFLNEISMSQK